MARTRGSKAAPKGDDDVVQEETQVKTLPPPENNPAKIFILPKDTSIEARIITLNDPAKGIPSRYLICPEKGPFEFTRIAAQKADPRSWMFTKDGPASKSMNNSVAKDGKDSVGVDEPNKEAYITRSQDLFIATPIDPIFLLIPIFSPSSTETSDTESGNGMFRTLEDYLDDSGAKITSEGSMLDMLSGCISRSEKFISRIPAICDVLDTGMDKVYQISVEKVASEIVKKATRIAEKGLPPSMRNHFVTRPLEPPIMAIKMGSKTTMTITTTTKEDETNPSTSRNETSQDGQESTDDDATQVASETTIDSQISTSSTIAAIDSSTDNSTVPPHVTHLSQIRTALTFILHSYIPLHLHASILQNINSSSQIDFEPLDKHIIHLEELRAEAQALRTMSDNMSRKRSGYFDEEEEQKRAEKRRKQEEDERRKKNENRAIKNLKKVNTKGMMKLSSFFGKKAVEKGKENEKA